MAGHSLSSHRTDGFRRPARAAGLVLLAAGALGAGSALADVPQQVVTVKLHYSKAELGSAEGAEHLYRRIQFAARQACGDPDGRELKTYFLAKRCYQRAVDQAVANVDAPSLTALHRSRGTRTAAG
ncbi:MAG TPA: UrcA family protein [Steroidobacteraceae bacterium]|nr:UrcA family protein [Steroidobacteraceae bacterium]